MGSISSGAGYFIVTAGGVAVRGVRVIGTRVRVAVGVIVGVSVGVSVGLSVSVGPGVFVGASVGGGGKG
ncbi:MAG: hypothetical protein WCF84_02710, partial [Anaerolineae bacterium]